MEKNTDFMALCETWIRHREPKFINCSAEWKHRQNNARGGGLVLLIRKGIHYTNLDLLPYNNGGLEFQAIKIKLENNSFISLLNI